MKKVAIYIRVSTEEQAKEGFSIPAQRHKLMSYAELNEWDIYDIYIDEGWSGAKLERPELTRLRNDMNQGKFDLVLVWRVDRFFRNVYYLSTLLHEMEKMNVNFKSMTESFDTLSPSGKAMLHMLAIFAEWERETIKERIMNALDERARQGLHHGPVPYGYERDEHGKLVIIPEQTKVIERIYEMRAKQHSYNEITDDLVRKFGLQHLKLENDTQVYWFIKRVLDNPVYRGNILRNGEELPGQHQAVVDETNAKLVDAQKGTRTDDHFYIFRGLFHCGVCGSRMRAKSRMESGKRVYFYYCPNSASKYSRDMKQKGYCKGKLMRENVALKHVQKILQEITFGFNKAVIEEEAQKNKTINNYESHLVQIDKRLDELRKRKTRYFLTFEEDPDFEMEAKERIKEITKQIQELQIEKQEMEESNLQTVSVQEFDMEAFKEILAQVNEAIKDYDREQLREIFLILFEKLTVHGIPGVNPGPGKYSTYLEPEWK